MNEKRGSPQGTMKGRSSRKDANRKIGMASADDADSRADLKKDEEFKPRIDTKGIRFY